MIKYDIKIRDVHSRLAESRVPIGRNTNLYHAKEEIHVFLNIQR